MTITNLSPKQSRQPKGSGGYGSGAQWALGATRNAYGPHGKDPLGAFDSTSQPRIAERTPFGSQLAAC